MNWKDNLKIQTNNESLLIEVENKDGINKTFIKPDENGMYTYHNIIFQNKEELLHVLDCVSNEYDTPHIVNGKKL